ncbi:MAG: hypothetical protein KF774_18575 [Planctomyces sp.]|nr:hypothetical protein [Planctomyces sp.]
MLRRSTTLLIMLATWMATSATAFAQVQFEADYLYMRQSGRDSGSLITGPGGLSTGDVNFGYESGFRFALSAGTDDWEIETMFSRVDGWSDSTQRTLGLPLLFDDAPFAGNRLGFVNSLGVAASNPNANGQDETLESERLQALATAGLRATSKFQDFELNLNTNRNRNWYRFGVGWRNLRLNENASLFATGTFDAIDTADGAVFGDPTNRPNDGLSDAALAAAGYSLLSGAGNGFDAADVPGLGPDTLTLYYGGKADNELNGIQATFAARLVPLEWMSVEGIAKMGVFHNSVRARAAEYLIGSGNDDSIYGVDYSDSKGKGAFAGSLGIQMTLPVTDYINIINAYEATYVNGVALGPNQIRGMSTDIFGDRRFSAQANSSLVLHGGRLGIEVLW